MCEGGPLECTSDMSFHAFITQALLLSVVWSTLVDLR